MSVVVEARQALLRTANRTIPELTPSRFVMGDGVKSVVALVVGVRGTLVVVGCWVPGVAWCRPRTRHLGAP